MDSQQYHIFHGHYGRHIRLKNDNRTAVRSLACQEFNHGIVLTKEPLQDDVLFQVEIERKIGTWSGSVVIGICSTSPPDIELKPCATDLTTGTWIMNGDNVLLNGQILLEKYGNGWDLDTLEEGDRVGVMKTSNGKLHFYINGWDLGVACISIPSTVYALVDLYGKCCQISILSPNEGYIRGDWRSHPLSSHARPSLRGRIIMTTELNSMANGVRREQMTDEMGSGRRGVRRDSWPDHSDGNYNESGSNRDDSSDNDTSSKDDSDVSDDDDNVSEEVTENGNMESSVEREDNGSNMSGDVDDITQDLSQLRVVLSEGRRERVRIAGDRVNQISDALDRMGRLEVATSSLLRLLRDENVQEENDRVVDITTEEIDRDDDDENLEVRNDRGRLTASDGLQFHECHGTRITLSNNNLTAVRENALDEFNNAVIMTNRLLIEGELFEVRIDKLVSQWSGSIEVGVSIHDPTSLEEFPSTMTNFTSGTIIMSGSAILTNGKGTRRQYGQHNLDELKEGDRVGVMLKANGNLHYYINGVDQGVATKHTPRHVYGVVDMYGRAAQVTLLHTPSPPSGGYDLTSHLTNSITAMFQQHESLDREKHEDNGVGLGDNGVGLGDNGVGLVDNGVGLGDNGVGLGDNDRVNRGRVRSALNEISRPTTLQCINRLNRLRVVLGDVDRDVSEVDRMMDEVHVGEIERDVGEIDRDGIGDDMDRNEGEIERDVCEIDRNVGEMNKNACVMDEGLREMDSVVGEIDWDVSEIHAKRVFESFSNVGESINNVDESISHVDESISNVDEIDRDVGEIERDVGEIERDVGEIERDEGEIKAPHPEACESTWPSYEEGCVSTGGPLEFHSRCGKRVMVENRNLTARRIHAREDFNNGVVFTSRPLLTGEVFEVRLDILVEKWSGSLEIGVTRLHPDSFNQLPPTMSQVEGQYDGGTTWIMTGSGVLRDGKLLLDDYGWNLDALHVGDRVGVVRKAGGKIHFTVNGMDLGEAGCGCEGDVWGVIDLYGQAAQATICSNERGNRSVDSLHTLPGDVLLNTNASNILDITPLGIGIASQDGDEEFTASVWGEPPQYSIPWETMTVDRRNRRGADNREDRASNTQSFVYLPTATNIPSSPHVTPSLLIPFHSTCCHNVRLTDDHFMGVIRPHTKSLLVSAQSLYPGGRWVVRLVGEVSGWRAGLIPYIPSNQAESVENMIEMGKALVLSERDIEDTRHLSSRLRSRGWQADMREPTTGSRDGGVCVEMSVDGRGSRRSLNLVYNKGLTSCSRLVGDRWSGRDVYGVVEVTGNGWLEVKVGEESATATTIPPVMVKSSRTVDEDAAALTATNITNNVMVAALQKHASPISSSPSAVCTDSNREKGLYDGKDCLGSTANKIDSLSARLVYSPHPVAIEEYSEISVKRVDEISDSTGASFAIGLCDVNPQALEGCKCIADILMWIDRTATNNVCYWRGKDIWCNKITTIPNYGPNLASLKVGDRIGCKISSDHSLYFYLNDINIGRASTTINLPAYLIIYINGCVSEVELKQLSHPISSSSSARTEPLLSSILSSSLTSKTAAESLIESEKEMKRRKNEELMRLSGGDRRCEVEEVCVKVEDAVVKDEDDALLSLRFSSKRHGCNVKIMGEEGSTAARVKGYNRSIVTMNRCVDPQETYNFRIDKLNRSLSGSLNLAITHTKPTQCLLNKSSSLLQFTRSTWCLKYDGTVYEEGIKVYPTRVTVDLTALHIGDVIGIRFDASTSSLHIYINGLHQGPVALSHTPSTFTAKQLYLLLDLYGKCEQISIVSQDDIPKNRKPSKKFEEKGELEESESKGPSPGHSIYRYALDSCPNMRKCLNTLKDLNLPELFFPPLSQPSCYCDGCRKVSGDEELYVSGGEPSTAYTQPFGWCSFPLRSHPTCVSATSYDSWHVAFHSTTASSIRRVLDTGELPVTTCSGGDECDVCEECRGVLLSPVLPYITQMQKVTSTLAVVVKVKPGSYQIRSGVDLKQQCDVHIPNEVIEWHTKEKGATILQSILIKII